MLTIGCGAPAATVRISYRTGRGESRRGPPHSSKGGAAALALSLLLGGLGCRSASSRTSDVGTIGTGGGGSAPGAGGAPEAAPVADGGGPQPVAFPLVYSANRRYFQDQAGRPFAIKGRASWGAVLVSAGDARAYLDDT